MRRCDLYVAFEEFVVERILARNNERLEDDDALDEGGFYRTVIPAGDVDGWVRNIDTDVLDEWFEAGDGGGFARIVDGVPVFEPHVSPQSRRMSRREARAAARARAAPRV